MTVQVKMAWHTPLSKRASSNAVGGVLQGTQVRRTTLHSHLVPPRRGRDRGTGQAASRLVRPRFLLKPVHLAINVKIRVRLRDHACARRITWRHSPPCNTTHRLPQPADMRTVLAGVVHDDFLRLLLAIPRRPAALDKEV